MTTAARTLLTVASKSSNANSFGLKMHIFMSENGRLYEGAANSINEISQGSSFYVNGTTDRDIMSHLIRRGFELTSCRGEASKEILAACFPRIAEQKHAEKLASFATSPETKTISCGPEENASSSDDTGSEMDDHHSEMKKAESIAKSVMELLEKLMLEDVVYHDGVSGFVINEIECGNHDYELAIQDAVDILTAVLNNLYKTE